MKMFSIQYSEALDGFYQSSIFVIAANKEQAKEKIRAEAIRLMDIKNPDYNKFEESVADAVSLYNSWDNAENQCEFLFLLEKDFENLVESRDCIFVHHSG